MFLDDQIVEAATICDWSHWHTRTMVEARILNLVRDKLVEKSDMLKKQSATDADLLLEMKRVRRAFDLGVNKISKKGIHILLTWDDIIAIIFEGNQLLIAKLSNV